MLAVKKTAPETTDKICVRRCVDPERFEQIHDGNTAIMKIHRPPTAANLRTDISRALMGTSLLIDADIAVSMENPIALVTTCKENIPL